MPSALALAFEALREVVGPLERAKAALTEAIPTTRLPGRPLAETLLEFDELLGEVRRGMDAWRAPEVDAEWSACVEGVDEALARAEHLRLEAPDPTGFEGLIGTIADLLAPLEAFGQAAERFRSLRA